MNTQLLGKVLLVFILTVVSYFVEAMPYPPLMKERSKQKIDDIIERIKCFESRANKAILASSKEACGQMLQEEIAAIDWSLSTMNSYVKFKKQFTDQPELLTRDFVTQHFTELIKKSDESIGTFRRSNRTIVTVANRSGQTALDVRDLIRANTLDIRIETKLKSEYQEIISLIKHKEKLKHRIKRLDKITSTKKALFELAKITLNPHCYNKRNILGKIGTVIKILAKPITVPAKAISKSFRNNGKPFSSYLNITDPV